MALELQLTRETVSAGASTMVITDSTGDYSAENLTGYNTPNPARNTLALVLRVYNKRYDGTSDLVNTLLSVSSYTAEAVTEWTVALNEDGWQQATVYGLNLYNVNTLLEVGELVWNASTDVIERITVRNGSGPYTYTKVSATEADLENASYTTAYSTVLNTYAIPGISEAANQAIQKYFDYVTDGTISSEDLKEAKEDAEEFDLMITSIIYRFEHIYSSEAQKQVESLENLIVD